MGGVKRDLFTRDLSVENAYDYQSRARVKAALQNLLQLHLRAEDGDLSSHSVWMDLQTALGRYESDSILSVVTRRQKEAIVLHLVLGYNEAETAKELGVTQQAVSYRITSGVRRIQQFLETGRVTWNEWGPDDEEFIIAHYYVEGPKFVAGHLGRKLEHVYSKAKQLKKKNIEFVTAG